MRRMSDTMEEGVIVEWLVKVGDTVSIGDVLAEVETDKATMDFDSQGKGTILHIEAQPGDTVPVDGVMAVVGATGEDFASLLDAAKNEAAAGGATAPAPVEVKEAAPAAPVAAAVSAPAPAKQVSAAPVVATSSADSNGRIKASPLAKRMAEEHGLDLALVSGTGEGGRIVKNDIANFDMSSIKQSAGIVASAIGQESHEDIPLSQMRKAIARRLSESKFTAPHFYLTREIVMDRVVEARKSINEYLGSKVSYNDIIIKAVAAALKANPDVNVSWMGDSIRKHHHVHIGVATAIDDGLIVPVVRHADLKPISSISSEVKELAGKARDKKLQPEEFSGNTFTISNLGMFGIEEFTAIINAPDACILAVGGIAQKPIVKNGEIVPGHVMKVTLSCDHRAVDGALGAQFLKTLAEFLEEPLRILA